MDRPFEIEELLKQAGWLRALAASLVSDPARADDLVQDTWVAALRRPPESESSPRPWLARVVRNLAHSAKRGDARRASREGFAHEERAEATPESIAQQAEAQRLLAAAVAELAEPLRAVIVLRYFQGLDSAAIARELGLPASTVRSRLQKALEELRAELDRKFEGGREAWSAVLGSFARRGGAVELVATGSTLAVVASVASVALLSVAGVAAWKLVSAVAEAKHVAIEERAASTSVVEESEDRAAPMDPAREPVVSAGGASEAAGATDNEKIELSGRVLVDGRPPEWPIGLSLTPDEATRRRSFAGGKQLRGVQFSLTLAPDTHGLFSSKLPASWSGALGVSYYTFDNGESSIPLQAPVSGLVLNLHPGPAIIGRLVDGAGAPVAGLKGSYEFRQDSRARMTPRAADQLGSELRANAGRASGDDNGASGVSTGLFECRSDGRFRVDLMTWGLSASATLLVEAEEGYLHLDTLTFDPRMGYDAGDLVLEPARALPFQVHDHDGRPIAGARAHLDYARWSQWSEPTGDDGRGELRFAPTRSVAIRIGALRFADQVVTVGSDDPPEIELEALSVIEIQLVGRTPTPAHLGRLVVSAERSLFADNDSISKWLQNEQEIGQPFEMRYPNGDGNYDARYRLREDGRYLLIGLQPDVPYSIDVQGADGRSLAVRNTSVAAHEWAKLEIPVGP